MAVIGAPDNLNPSTSTLSDTELLMLFHRDPQRAWELFIEKYADPLFSYLHNLGFNYDQAMDRFVYICEKLCEQDFPEAENDSIRREQRRSDALAA